MDVKNKQAELELNDKSYYVKTLQGRLIDLLNDNLYLQAKLAEVLDEKKELQDKLKVMNK